MNRYFEANWRAHERQPGEQIAKGLMCITPNDSHEACRLAWVDSIKAWGSENRMFLRKTSRGDFVCVSRVGDL